MGHGARVGNGKGSYRNTLAELHSLGRDHYVLSEAGIYPALASQK